MLICALGLEVKMGRELTNEVINNLEVNTIYGLKSRRCTKLLLKLHPKFLRLKKRTIWDSWCGLGKPGIQVDAMATDPETEKQVLKNTSACTHTHVRVRTRKKLEGGYL